MIDSDSFEEPQLQWKGPTKMVIQRFIVNISASKKGEPVRMAKAFQEVDDTSICQCVWYLFLSGMFKFAIKT